MCLYISQGTFLLINIFIAYFDYATVSSFFTDLQSYDLEDPILDNLDLENVDFDCLDVQKSGALMATEIIGLIYFFAVIVSSMVSCTITSLVVCTKESEPEPEPQAEPEIE